MSASGAGGPRIRRLFKRASNADNIGDVIFKGLAAIGFAIATALADGFLTLADVIIVPLNALIDGTNVVLRALFGSSARILNLGGLASALSLGPSGLFASPVSFILAVAVILGAFYLIGRFLGLGVTGNFVPTIPFDVPTPGYGGPEEDAEEE